MIESLGALVDFSDVVSFNDPTVAATLASIVKDRLAATHCREFRLTSRVLVLVFNAHDAVLAQRSLSQLDRDLVSSHHGKLTWRIFDLNSEIGLFRTECMNLVDRATGRGGHEELLFRLDADRLSALMHIVDSLATVDLATHMRNQPAVRFEDGQPKSIEFEEYWVSLESLEQAFETPLQSDSFRFSLVTELLDMRVLRSIVEDKRISSRVSLNFHARNALTSQFDAIVQRIVESRRRQMIFEMSVKDFIHDRELFMAATKKLRKFGFQVALDGVIWPAVESISSGSPEIQLIKAPWNEAFKDANEKERSAIRDVMARYPSKIFVLSRCEDQEACRIGFELGFQVLQGRGVRAPATLAPQARRSISRQVSRLRH